MCRGMCTRWERVGAWGTGNRASVSLMPPVHGQPTGLTIKRLIVCFPLDWNIERYEPLRPSPLCGGLPERGFDCLGVCPGRPWNFAPHVYWVEYLSGLVEYRDRRRVQHFRSVNSPS